MSANLLKLLNSIYPLSEALKTEVEKRLYAKDLKKKEILLKEGQICNNIYFVEYGMIKAYYKRNEKEVTSWFMKENDIIIMKSIIIFIAILFSFFYADCQSIDSNLLYKKRIQKIETLTNFLRQRATDSLQLDKINYKLIDDKLYDTVFNHFFDTQVMNENFKKDTDVWNVNTKWMYAKLLMNQFDFQCDIDSLDGFSYAPFHNKEGMDPIIFPDYNYEKNVIVGYLYKHIMLVLFAFKDDTDTLIYMDYPNYNLGDFAVVESFFKRNKKIRDFGKKRF